MTEQPARIALVSGFWGQNIGNAFFNIGGKWILEQAFPDARVDFIQDQPGYRTFHRQSKGNPRNDLGLLSRLKADAIVLQGPLLTRNVGPLWLDTLRQLRARGTKVILLSAGLFQYDAPEIRVARQFLAEVRPEIVVTRDQPTYDAIADMCPVIYSGIDSAFFAPKVHQPFDLDIHPYIAMNFDRYPEPDFCVAPAQATVNGPDVQRFDMLGLRWEARTPRLPSSLARRGQWQSYFGSLADRRQLPAEIAGYTVVRPEHRFNPHVGWKIYKQPNAAASDEPFTYLTIYAGASLTLSDRVHACVATLAYGRPAMLFAPTPRGALFERLGMNAIRERPVELDPCHLEQERQAEVAFLRERGATLW